MARRFDELQGSLDSVSRQSPRFDALQSSIEAISRQVEAARADAGERADQQLVAMRQIESLRRDLDDLSRAIGDLAPRASIAAIETALRDLAHRIDVQRDRGVADVSLAPAERIAGELRAVIRDLDPTPVVRNLHADVLTIGRRLDELAAPGAGDAEALRELSAQTREVKELLTALAARPLPVEKLETRVLDLTQRVDSLALTGVKGAGGKDIGDVAKAIRSIVETETGKGFQAFNQRLERLSAKLDEALAKSGGKRFDEINERIDQLGKSLAQRIDRAGAQKALDTTPLEDLVAKLAKKIDSALDSKGASPAFDELGQKIEKLEARLADPAAAASIARIESMLAKPGHERHLADLSQRIDLLHKSLASRAEQAGAARDGDGIRHVEELAKELGSKIDAAMRPGAGARDFESLERQIEQLSRKLDRLDDNSTTAKLDELLARPLQSKQLHEIAERIDFLHTSLATRIEEGARSRVETSNSELAALVEQLTKKMNSALDPVVDASAMQSLEKQIQNLARRLDRTDENGAALFSIERKIAELFQRIEETRTATTEAAEQAVRRATQEILREAATANPGALNEMVERQIADIRKSQDDSGVRTHETLIAVHETLERVVDRLAVFEDELSEIRDGSPVGAAPPPRPAPSEAPRRASSPPAATMAAERPAPRSANIDDDEEDIDDLLIEPTPAPAARREPSLSVRPGPAAAAPAGERSTQSDFIAAARRAAQQAALDAEAAEAQKNRRATDRKDAKSAAAPAASVGGLAKVGASLAARKRPLLLGLGALVLLVGAYQVARIGIEGREHAETAAHSAHVDAAVEPPQTGASAPADADAAPKEAAAPNIAAPPPPKFMTPQQAPPLAPEPGARGAGPSVARPPMLSVPPGDPPAQNIAPKPGRSAGAEGALDQTPVASIERPGVSPQDALAAIRALAGQGDAAAQYELGSRYVEGRGLGRDAKAAAQWYEKAAAQGLAPAQYRLGALYEKGVGVERDYERAKALYQTAAQAGNARSMHNLAVLLAEGGGGKPDYVAAAEWFRKAAELGVRDSQYNLAILCARGLGVPQSLPQSYAWFAAAAAQGDADAGKKRDEVGARLDSKDLASAKALTDAFRPRQPNRQANDVAAPEGGWENAVGKAPAARPDARPAGKAKISRI
jgi:localization factor PodJL